MNFFKTPEFISVTIGTIILGSLALYLGIGIGKTQYSTSIDVERRDVTINLIGDGCVKVVYYEGLVKQFVNNSLVNEKLIVTNFSHAERVECP
jgi:hypothetical protein